MPNTPDVNSKPPQTLPELQQFGGRTLAMPSTPGLASPQSAGTAIPQTAAPQQASTQAPDPLADLRDIQVQADIAAWPPALGWWLLFLIAALAVFVLTAAGVQRFKRSLYKRLANRELTAIKESYHLQADTRLLINELSILLKRICLTRHPRKQVAGLSGENWLAFLDKTGNTNEFSAGCGQALVNERFMPNTDKVDGKALISLCEHWVKQQ